MHEVVIGTETLPEVPENETADQKKDREKKIDAFLEKDTLAQLIIVGNLDDKHSKITSQCETAAGIWSKLLAIYEQSDGQRLDRLLEKCFRAKFGNEEKIQMNVYSSDEWRRYLEIFC